MQNNRMGWVSIVGVATDYGLEFSVLERWWSQRFSLLHIPADQPPFQLVSGISFE
jgi:hypothetical protein